MLVCPSDGQQLTSDADDVTITAHGGLLMSAVDVDAAGAYYCRAAASASGADSAPASVTSATAYLTVIRK